MGIADCFQQYYGPDLINTAKEGAAYYERIFADVNIEPENAIVVDDSLLALGWASEAGAQTIHCSSKKAHPSFPHHINRLAELPGVID
jgi:FMN phosphatase YigB (HAD superfamily)